MAAEKKTRPSDFRIARVELDEATIVRRGPQIEHERRAAMFDLVEESDFRPRGSAGGPYHLRLSAEGNRLVLTIFHACDPDGEPHGVVILSLSPFRRIVRDYFLICESYYDAIKTATLARIEAIDMSRRALHNDGSALLRERLAGKIDIDDNTARGLFTLVCVLHLKG